MAERMSTLDVVRAERPYEPLEHGAWKTGRVFADFVVDGISLSTVVRHKADLISVLGWGSEQVQREVRDRLLLQAPADLPSNRRALYVCPECGDLSCGAVSAVIDRLGEMVVWRDFGYENDYEDKAPDRQHLEALGEYRFAWDTYESAINRGYGLGGFDVTGVVRKPRWWQRALANLLR